MEAVLPAGERILNSYSVSISKVRQYRWTCSVWMEFSLAKHI
jgi:hypothetical protein